MNKAAATPNASRRRWMVWGLLLALTLSAMAWLDDGDTAVDKGRKRARRAPSASAEQLSPPASASAQDRLALALERLELPTVVKAAQADPAAPGVPEKSEKPDGGTGAATQPDTPLVAPLVAPLAPVDLLAARSWYVAPPPPPPEVPKPPALPFKVVGRIIEGDSPAVFLASQNRNLVAREGVFLDNTYLVERIEKTRMTFIYLPLAERQYLTLGAVN